MVKFGVYLPQYNTNISQLISAALLYEKLGLDSVWLEDHFEPWTTSPEASCPECWTTLSAVASVTRRIKLGSLCSSNVYRQPALLAKMAVTLTEVSNRRLELGISPGWGKRELGTPKGEIEEFESYGISFPAAKERIAALENGIRAIRATCRKIRPSSSITRRLKMRSYNAVQFAPRIWVCGIGDIMMRCIAKNADAWNAAALSPDEFRERNQFLNHCCRRYKREPRQILRSIKLLFDPENREVSVSGLGAKKSFLWSLFYKTRLYGSRRDFVSQIKDFIDVGVEYFTLFTSPRDADARSTALILIKAVRENFWR